MTRKCIINHIFWKHQPGIAIKMRKDSSLLLSLSFGSSLLLWLALFNFWCLFMIRFQLQLICNSEAAAIKVKHDIVSIEFSVRMLESFDSSRSVQR